MESPGAASLPTVLVVDDEPVVREYMTRALRELCVAVLTARDGLEAIQMLAATPGIAAVVTDIQMPRCDGIDVASFARTLPGSPPVLFVSGAANEPLPGAFLQKPFRPDALAGAVRQLLADMGQHDKTYQTT